MCKTIMKLQYIMKRRTIKSFISRLAWDKNHIFENRTKFLSSMIFKKSSRVHKI